MVKLRIVNGLPAEAVEVIRWQAQRAAVGRLSYRQFMENVERSLRAKGLWHRVALAR